MTNEPKAAERMAWRGAMAVVQSVAYLAALIVLVRSEVLSEWGLAALTVVAFFLAGEFARRL